MAARAFLFEECEHTRIITQRQPNTSSSEPLPPSYSDAALHICEFAHLTALSGPAAYAPW